MLTAQEYGVVDLIITYITLLAPLFMLQLDRPAFRYLIDARGDVQKVTNVLSSTLAIVTPVLLAASAVFLLVNQFIHVPYAYLIVAAIVATVYSTILLQTARGLGRNMVFSLASVASALALLAATLILVVMMRWGVEGVLWSTIAANVSSILFVATAVRVDRLISVSGIRRSMQNQLLSFSWPLVPSAISWWLIRASDRTIIVIILGAAANGVYAAASKYAIIFLALYSIFDLAWTESASAHIESDERDQFFYQCIRY